MKSLQKFRTGLCALLIGFLLSGCMAGVTDDSQPPESVQENAAASGLEDATDLQTPQASELPEAPAESVQATEPSSAGPSGSGSVPGTQAPPVSSAPPAQVPTPPVQTPAPPAQSQPAPPVQSQPAPPSSSSTSPGNPSSPPGVSNTTEAFAARVVELVNQERAKQGIAPLSAAARLMDAALIRSQELVTKFQHERPNGQQGYGLALDAGYRRAGENIAYGYSTPEAVVTAWMNSEGHRRNILNGSFTHIGVGCYRSGGLLYWTQLFGGTG